jgi:hypothetical protein
VRYGAAMSEPRLPDLFQSMATAFARAALSGEHLRRLEEPAAQAANVFRSQGGVWTLTFDGVTAHLPDSKGLRDLATLLGGPWGGGPRRAATRRPSARRRRRPGAGRPGPRRLPGAPGRAGRRARPGRRRQRPGPRRPGAARTGGPTGRAVQGDRPRGPPPPRLGDDTERARKAVSARIHEAIARIERVNPALGRHLRQAVATGTQCSYTPPEPVHWRL